MSIFERDLVFIAAASRTEKAPGLDERLTHDEIAFWLRRSRRFITAMKRWGWEMEFDPVQRREFGTLQSALDWLKRHPEFRVDKDPPLENAHNSA